MAPTPPVLFACGGRVRSSQDGINQPHLIGVQDHCETIVPVLPPPGVSKPSPRICGKHETVADQGERERGDKLHSTHDNGGMTRQTNLLGRPSTKEGAPFDVVDIAQADPSPLHVTGGWRRGVAWIPWCERVCESLWRLGLERTVRGAIEV